jgi:hypothetical protein
VGRACNPNKEVCGSGLLRRLGGVQRQVHGLQRKELELEKA